MKKCYSNKNMNFYELLLNRLFFLVDKVRGNHIGNELTELEVFYNSATMRDQQLTRFNKFINYVSDNVPFYRGMSVAEITKLPVINKKYIGDNINQFISEEFNRENLIKISTSGSYGTPMTFYRTKAKQVRQTAEVIFFGTDLDYYIGRNHAFIRGVSKSKIKLLLQNEVHINPTYLDDGSLTNIVNNIKKAKFIIGFPSVLMSVIKYCNKKGVNPREFDLMGIITTSEPLHDSQRKIIQDFFKCPVSARYATEELGIIANQCFHTENYHINEASFIVEVLKKDSDEQVDYGEEGRIVVTDLYSTAMPLIRYETGDYGILEKSCSCGYHGKVLKTISGRQIQSILDANNNEISPFSINVRMKDYKGIYQFQFIQNNYNDYRMLLVSTNNFSEEKAIKKDLKKILGDKAYITIEKVEEIPALSSGKRPYIINKLNE